jgi:hypothetical protein
MLVILATNLQCVSEIGGFRIKPIFTTAPAASKIDLNLIAAKSDLKRIFPNHSFKSVKSKVYKVEATSYSVIHRFREAKFDNDGSILSSSQFLLLP